MSVIAAVEHVASLVPGPPLALDQAEISAAGIFASAFDVGRPRRE